MADPMNGRGEYITYRQALVIGGGFISALAVVVTTWMLTHSHRDSAQSSDLEPIRFAVVTNATDIRDLANDVEQGQKDMTLLIVMENKSTRKEIRRAILELLEKSREMERDRRQMDK